MAAMNVRTSPLAGRWYPGDADALMNMVDRYLEQPLVPEKPLYGILVPHAGLMYSGSVAGKAFRYTYELDVETVVIVAPSHHRYPAALLSTGHTHFETPLGRVQVAVDLLEALEAQVKLLRVTDDPEHAIEIELPFLQCTLGAFNILPLAMIDQSWQTAQRLGEVLAEIVAGRRVLWVASSDLSHFYTQSQAKQLDQVVLDAVAAYDPEGVIQADEDGRGFACGRAAIATVMVAARKLGATTAQIVGYATSGDVLGDMSRVVGYGAALFN